MPANMEHSAMATGLGKNNFHCNTKEGNAKECSNYHTIALISHASKVMLKILQVRLQLYMNWELPDFEAGFREGRGRRDQIANVCWIIEKQENSIKTSIFALLIMPKPLTVWITTNWKILQMGTPDHLTYLLRNLCAGQEAKIRTGHGPIDWFQIGKGICQGNGTPLQYSCLENPMDRGSW